MSEPLTKVEAHIWQLASDEERRRNAANPRVWVLNKLVNLGHAAQQHLDMTAGKTGEEEE